MDFRIDMTNGLGEMTFEKSEDIMNNVYLSLMVRKGSFFQNPDFGSRLHLLKRAKNTEQTAALAREYCKEALRWLLNTGRATKIDVYSERDLGGAGVRDRLKLLVEVTQADGRKLSFATFLEVV